MNYLIQGGKPLSGEIELSGAKNAALKLIIAALICEGVSVIHNVPHIRDVVALVEIINFLGGRAEFTDENTIEVENKLKSFKLPLEYAARTRTSFMLIAPILFTFGKALVANPGGCRIGARPVDRLVKALESFGVDIHYTSTDGYYHAQLDSIHQAHVTFSKKTHTGTELALIFAARVAGETTISNASTEPEIDDLIEFLTLAGASVKKQNDTFVVSGKAHLAAHTQAVQYDRNEAVSFIIFSALCKGAISVRNVDIAVIEDFLRPFRQAGFSYDYNEHSRLFRTVSPSIIKPVDVTTAVHPGFMTDWQPMWALLMTQAVGVSTIHETVFEDRFGYVSELNKLGAKIEFFAPHVDNPEKIYQFNWTSEHFKKQAIRIHGPRKLHEGIVTSTDIRAGASLLFAAIFAHGTSAVTDVEQLERGYERLIERLRRVGVHVQVEQGER